MFPVTVSCQGCNSDEIFARCSHDMPFVRTDDALSGRGRKRPWASLIPKKSFRFVHVNFASHKIHSKFSVHFASMFVRLEGLPTNLVVPVWKTLWASSNRAFQSFPKTVSDRIFQISGVTSEVFPSFGGFCFGNFSTSSSRGSLNFC